MFQESFKYLSRKFQECIKKVFRVFQGSFKGVSRKFQGCFKEISGVFQETLKGVTRVFLGCFKEVSGMFQESFMDVSRKVRGGVTKKNGKIWDNVPIRVDPPSPSDIWDIFEFETFLKNADPSPSNRFETFLKLRLF